MFVVSFPVFALQGRKTLNRSGIKSCARCRSKGKLCAALWLCALAAQAEIAASFGGWDVGSRRRTRL